MPVRRLDDAAAEAFLVVVEHHVLPGSDGALRLGEFHLTTPGREHAHVAILIGLSIPDLGRGPEMRRWGLARDPGELRRGQLAAEQRGMIVTLDDDQDV